MLNLIKEIQLEYLIDRDKRLSQAFSFQASNIII